MPDLRLDRDAGAVGAGGADAAGQGARREAQTGTAQRPASRPRQGELAGLAPTRSASARLSAMTASAEQRREGLIGLYREVSSCTRCPLHEGRTRAVFGAGNANAELMFVGEAPGAEEDRQGLPFVGRAGQLLTELLGGIELTREDVFIANVLKSRPPGNRDPQPDEIEACWPYLERQIQLIEPRVIATLGNFATKKITGSPAGITRVKGVPQVHELAGRTVFVFPLLHPAAALRTPSLVDALRRDFAKLPALLREPLPELEPPAGATADPVAGTPDPASQLDLFG